MAFVNLSILLGVAAVGIPIVLHLVMRQKPKQIEFPAVMFLKARKESNKRRLQLRHWILLALRVLAILFFVLALARPSVASALVGNWIIISILSVLSLGVGGIAVVAFLQKRGWLVAGSLAALAAALLVANLVMLGVTLASNPGVKIGQAEAPVAAVMLFDTAPRMLYRHANETRLQKAQKIAGWLIGQFPEESDVAIADSNLGASVFAVDRGAARKSLAGLVTDSASRPFADVVTSALDLALTSNKNRKEVYLFTDLTQLAWPNEAAAAIDERLREAKDLSLYVVDVGAERPQNFALGEVILSRQMLSRNADLEVAVPVSSVGEAGERVIELNLEKYEPTLPIIKDGQPVLPENDPARRRRQTVNLAKDGAAAVQFSVAGLDIGTHHGTLRFDRDDNLPIDDVRYFTLEVREPWPVLVAAGPDANAKLLTEALAPYEFRATDQARFHCTEIPIEKLGERQLRDYKIVYLLDPPPLSAGVWQRLAAFAQEGGSVAIFLGHNATLANFNAAPAQELLPAKLATQSKSLARPRDFSGQADIYLAPRVLEHPLLANFRDVAANVPWFDFPVFRYWSFDGTKLAAGSQVVATFSNRQPAIVERPLGQGRVLIMTTPISDPAAPKGREAWNWLPTGFEPWPYVMLANEMGLYLAGSGDAKLNYLTGQTAVLEERAGDGGSYLLFTPQGTRPQTIRASDGLITVPFTSTPGNYRLKSSESGELRGFSVNLPVEASDLTRIDKAKLEDILGAGRFKLARQETDIEREQGEERVGREFFPLLMILAVIVLGVEQLLANRFYRQQE